MSFFPVIGRRSDFALVRAEVERIHRESFAAAFRRMTPGAFAQFSIMMNLLFYNDVTRSTYAWKFLETDASYNRLSPGQPSAEYYRKLRAKYDTSPIVIPAIHVPYTRVSGWGWPAVVEGFCYAVEFRHELCERGGSQGNIRDTLFHGDGELVWTFHPGCVPEQRRYYREVEDLGDFFTPSQVQMITNITTILRTTGRLHVWDGQKWWARLRRRRRSR
jgi:hypothetical protein